MAEAKKIGRPSTGKPVILRIPATEETRNALEAAAKEKHRSMASFAGGILEETLGTATSPAPQSAAPKAKRPKTGGRISEGATALLTISLQPELKAAVKRIAGMERRTASNMACLMLRDWILEWEHDHPGVNVWPDAVEE